MAAPIAAFTFIVNPSNPLEITLQGGLSSNGEPIVSWDWNFGDATAHDITQNTTHTYATPGVYLITLTVTNADGSSQAFQYILMSAGSTIFSSIAEMVKCKLPEGWDDAGCIHIFTRTWQLFLQPQVNPNPIADADVYNEQLWPALWNVLISELVVYEVITQRLTQLSIGGNVNSTTTGTGAQKSIETGPAKAEWYDDSTRNLENQARFATAVFSNAGLINQYKSYICMFASRVGATLPFCKQAKENFLFEKVGRPIITNPLNILT